MDWSRIGGIASSILPVWVSRRLRLWTAHLRYLLQRLRCRRAYRSHAHRYPQPILFVAGLPKSGTTWMEKMLSGYRGMEPIMPPEVVEYEVANAGTHDFQLSGDLTERLDGLLAVVKLHIDGSRHNADVLAEAGIPYVVMYRDLRDVAVSYVFYARRTSWHPEHAAYRNKSVEEGLRRFGTTLLSEYAAWIRSWHANRNPDGSVVVRYEDLLQRPRREFGTVADLFGLPADAGTIASIVETHSFDRMSGGRQAGNGRADSFYRKGIAGDWKNHFTPKLCELFRDEVGELLIELGYESDLDW